MTPSIAVQQAAGAHGQQQQCQADDPELETRQDERCRRLDRLSWRNCTCVHNVEYHFGIASGWIGRVCFFCTAFMTYAQTVEKTDTGCALRISQALIRYTAAHAGVPAYVTPLRVAAQSHYDAGPQVMLTSLGVVP